ncbi:MAG: hypothetical protein ACSHX6_07430 [Akkermansiaceae bacterium]
MSRRFLFIILIFAFVAGVVGYVIYDSIRDRVETVFEIVPVGVSKYRTLMTRAYEPDLFDKGESPFYSERVLGRAIEDYDLVRLFDMGREVLLAELRDGMELSSVRYSDLLRLRVSFGSKLRSEQVSYAVVQTFATLRREGLERRREESIREFADKLRIQEDKVEDHRVRLTYYSEEHLIPYDVMFGEGQRGRSEDGETEDGDLVILGADWARIEKVREDYERELAILEAIKEAEFSEFMDESLWREPIIIHEAGWSDEVGAQMRVK